MDLQDQITIPTPEGIDLVVVLAGVGSRGGAVIIDLLIQYVVFFVVMFGLAFEQSSNGVVEASVFVFAFLVFLGYFPLFEAFANGRTLGKRALGIRVVRLDGTPLTFWRALIRNLVRVIDALPFGYVVGIVSVMATQRNQRLGDLVAGTVVVRDRRAGDAVTTRRAADLSASPATWAAAAAAPQVSMPPEAAGWDLSAVTPADIAALRTFLDRRWTLTPEARYRLALDFANRLQPVVVGPPVNGGPEQFLEWIVYVKQFRG